MTNKLSLEELKVRSFLTNNQIISGGRIADVIDIEKTNDPTAQTFCFHCPPATLEC